MEYLVADFKIKCPDELLQTARDLLADVAGKAGFESFEDSEDGLNGYVQRQLFDKDKLEEGISSFPLHDTSVTYTIDDVESEDWNETWEREGFEPIDIDGKLLIVDCNHNPLHSDHSPQIIKIDAKLAFGTGTHETTQMIVSTLLGLNLKGKRVLDCGCGTGILAIAACVLGAEDAVAYDIDEWSVENTRHNASLNAVDNVTVLHGDADILNKVEGEFDIVLANINRNILLHDMTAFRKKMKRGGLLIVSGFYEDDVKMLEDKAARLGLKTMGIREKGDWRMIEFLGVNDGVDKCKVI